MNTENGFRDFVSGDVLLFDGGLLGTASICSEEDFETEFRKVLLGNQASPESPDASTNTSSLFTPNLTICESYQPTKDRIVNTKDSDNVRFEEDPLSLHFNHQQLQQSFDFPATKKRRGRPPLIKFKCTDSQKMTHRPRSNRLTVESLPLTGSTAAIQIRNRRFDGDNYSPLWVRGKGVEREGCCPLCSPPIWLKIKQSAYWYHMNFFHGISATSGQPYKRPIAYRVAWDANHQSNRVEGHCATCLQWVVLVLDYHTSNQSFTNPEIEDFPMNSWYRHAQKCHYRLRELDIPSSLE